MRVWLAMLPMVLGATPAAAQIWDGPSGNDSRSGVRASPLRSDEIDTRGIGETRRIRGDIRDGFESGQLSRTDARRLRREAYQIDRLASRYRRGGLSDSEAAELTARRELLRNDVTAMRSGRR